MPKLSPKVDSLLPHVPSAFFRIEIIEAAVARLIIARMIENKELCFRSPERVVANLGALEIAFRLLCDKPWIPLIIFTGNRIHNIAG